MSPIPELEPIREDATLNATQFVAALQAMAEEAAKAAAEMAKLNAELATSQRIMDGMAAGAAEAAAAEETLAKAERDVATGAAAAGAAEDAAAGAADNLAKANTAAGAAAFSAAKFQETLTAASLASAAAERTAANAADASRDAYAGMAAAEAAAAAEAEKLAAAEAAGSLAAAQDAQMAKALAEADAVLAAGENLAADAAEKQAAAMAAATAGMLLSEKAALGVGKAADDSGAAATRAGIGFRFWGIGMALTRNALHWIVAGTAEFLAVGVPAFIALASGLAVAAQGAQNVQQHFTALYAATESTALAMHKTVGSVLGVGHALQTAQDAANPGVYELLGSAINDASVRVGAAKTQLFDFAGAGLQVVHMLDEFAARVTVDLKGALGTQLQGLMAGAVHDLQQFGQVLGNLGHALLNFAAAMPGLAHVLLTIAVALSEVVMWASRGGILLTFAMAMEEVFRWGGLVLTMLVRLTGQMAVMNSLGSGGFLFRFGAALITLVGGLGRAMFAVGAFVAELDILPAVAQRAGAGLAAAGAEVDGFAAALSPGMVVGVVAAAAALTFLFVKIASIKDATDQWVAASSQAVAKASDLNVLPAIYNQLAQSIIKSAAAQQNYTQVARAAGTQTGEMTARFGEMNGGVQRAAQDTVELGQHMMSLLATANTVRGNIGLLAGVFHTSAIGALALANAAGINLQVGLTKGSEAAKIAEQQITNLKTGLGAMAAPAGVIGADMEAIGVQSQLASSKVGTVNQALDAFIGSTTGGMNSVMQFNAALSAMGKDTAARSQSITGAINSISRSAASMGFTLSGIGPKAQQSWQQFDAAEQQANSVLDTMRTGMAENVVSAGLYRNSILEAGGALLPFAAHNATALHMVSQLAQEAGFKATGSMKTLAADFGITGKAAQDKLAAGVERAIARMSNLSTVARNLSATISGQLDSAMAGAIVKASGLDKAYSKWATDVMNNAAPKTLTGDLAAINAKAALVNTTQAKATKLLNDSGVAAKNYGTALKGASTGADAVAKSSQNVSTAAKDVAARVQGAGVSAQGFGQQAHTAAGSAQGLASQASTATTQVRNLGTASGVTRGSLGTVNNEIRTTGTAAGNSAGPLGTMTGNIRNVGSAASTAAGQVHALAVAISGLQSKTITVTTNVVTVTSTVHRAAGGPVFPGVPTVVGEAGREMYVPAVPGYIFNHAQTEQMMGGGSSSGGKPAAAPAAPAAGSGGGAGTLVIQMNSREVARAVMPELWRWMTRNQGQVTGSLKPS